MENEKRLIDGFELLDKALLYYTECERSGKLVHASCEIKQKIADMVHEAPTVDAVEVVRCYQCKHSDVCEDGTIFCKLHSELGEREERGNAYSVWMEPDDFCSYGERKSDDE